jgi:RNA polymerase sigma-70 factor (ECF subfamily)
MENLPTDSLTDVEILRQSLKNPVLFGVLIQRYQAPFLKRAAYIVHNADEAEDIVQDTFVKIYSHGHQFVEQEGASFSSWAYKILLNTCFSRYKKLKRERSTIAVSDDILALAPSRDEVYFEDKVRVDYVLSLLATLPTMLRRVLTLHYLKGWSYAEVASAEGVSPGAIRTRVHRAKRLLESRLNNHD